MYLKKPRESKMVLTNKLQTKNKPQMEIKGKLRKAPMSLSIKVTNKFSLFYFEHL